MDNIDTIQILSYFRNTFEQEEVICEEPISHLFVDIECTSFVTALNKAIDALHWTNKREGTDENNDTILYTKSRTAIVRN